MSQKRAGAVPTEATQASPAVIVFGTRATQASPPVIVFGTRATQASPAVIVFGTRATQASPPFSTPLPPLRGRYTLAQFVMGGRVFYWLYRIISVGNNPEVSILSHFLQPLSSSVKLLLLPALFPCLRLQVLHSLYHHL